MKVEYRYNQKVPKLQKFEEYYQGKSIRTNDYRLRNYIARNWEEFKKWSWERNTNQ